MPSPTGKNDACRSLYSQGLTVAAIAKKLKISRTTVTSYRKQDKDTDRDWDKLRADLKGKTPPPKPNLVTFERPRGEKAKAIAKPLPPQEKDLLEVIKTAIAAVAMHLSTADNLQGVGGAANGLVALGKFKLELESDEDALQRVLERYKSPRELAAKLRELGWGREQA
jgi:hypothetical protein